MPVSFLCNQLEYLTIQRVIFLVFIYLLYLTASLHEPLIVITMLVNAVSYTTILPIYLKLRQKTTRHMQDIQEYKEITLIDQIGECVANYRLIGDYYRRPMVARRVEESIGAYNDAVTKVASVRVNSEWVLHSNPKNIVHRKCMI